ncbi:MAG: acyl-CoA synthase [Chloroflexi bacterium]|jgi:long-chain acyl-CoA synthetase|nr:MAG: acyl-CoA synthase [Gammaproteobacteria bacterium]RUA21674.1 MAG: acyl-CoA synthase [Chloroflexota bacterium]
MVTTLGEISRDSAKLFGDKTALIIEDKSFSYKEIDAMACRVANGLDSVGVRPGDRVTLYSHNCWEWVVSYHAIAKVGAVINPINVMLTADEVKYVLEDNGAKAVLGSADKAEALLDLKGTGVLNEVVLFGNELPVGATSFNDWLKAGADQYEAAEQGRDELAAICYTSGTTGHPKGAMHSHRNIVSSAEGTALMHVRTSRDILVNPLPLPHVYGSCVFNASFMYGMTLVILARFEETAVFSAIQEHGATLLDGVPTVYYYLLAHPKFEKYNLSSLTRACVGGQTLPVAKSHEWQTRAGCPVLELWGMTELAGLATANPLYGENKPGTIGPAIPGSTGKIVAVDDPGQDLAYGEEGELMFQGPLVMKGYYRNDAATNEVMEPGGWLHTGDIATQDEQGYFAIVDRKKDMILSAGYNVYPAELERVICGHPAVALAAVGRIPDEAKGELAKAYVVLKPEMAATGQEIVEFCREQLAAYKVPRAVQFVDSVPQTSSGKIMRRLLTDIDDGGRDV